jgi:hypothetical protein
MLTGFVLATGCQEILHTRKMGNIEQVKLFAGIAVGMDPCQATSIGRSPYLAAGGGPIRWTAAKSSSLLSHRSAASAASLSRPM